MPLWVSLLGQIIKVILGMLNELIDNRDGFKVIPNHANLGKNEIIEYIISISTISLS